MIKIFHNDMKQYILNKRLICDLELLLNGGFKPLTGFLNEIDYYSVLNNMRLSSGEIWPMPIVLPIDDNFIKNYKINDEIKLCNEENLPLASIKIESIYKPDIELECLKVFGSNDDNHPYVKIIHGYSNCHYVGGKVTQINKIPHFDFLENRMTPEETKLYFKNNNWKNIVGFQTRNPMHRSHYELTKYAMDRGDAKLFANQLSV